MISVRRKESRLSLSVFYMAFVAFLAAAFFAPASRADGGITLREGWAVQSSAKVNATADAISVAGFDASSWYKASAPNT
ncbi:MAG TPA: hypothetical protein VHU84_18505, partial [Lacipirellulaceae bacterium]|nr:hypothetical protein [Lacipirellulaceae bacterium]